MLLLILVACRAVDDTGAPDADQDGFTSLEDCDDLNNTVWPGAPEICNGVDDDCDGTVDNASGAYWYVDADGDRYGDPDTAQAACDVEGLVSVGTDCDDQDAAVHPGASEWCNEVDDDCDGETDEDPLDVLVQYPDADGDGWGAEQPTLSCELLSGTVERGGDCDDQDDQVHPGASEWCNDVDDDCDGSLDEDAADALDWWTDNDGDGFGTDPVLRSCSQPSSTTDNDRDCDDTDAQVHPDAEELCNSLDDDCDGSTDPADSSDATSWYADADGDGYGTPLYTVDACEQPSGWVDDDSDCDDTDDQATPDTVWYLDYDGDGYGDASVTTQSCSQPSGFVEDDTDCDDADSTNWLGDTWYLDCDGDGYGDSAGGTTTACTQPSGYAATDDDCDDGDSTVNPGATESCNGVDDDCDGSVDNSTACSGCEYEENNSHSYLFCNTTTMVWADARSTCQGFGYDLVTIDDSTENAWVTSTHVSHSMGSPWIGFNDLASEGTWVWADGTATSYTNWSSGEPNDSGGEDCAHIYTNGQWNDHRCTVLSAYFICES